MLQQFMLYVLLVLFQMKKIHSEGLPKKLSTADYNKVIFAQVGKALELTCPIETAHSETFIDWFKGDESLYMEKGFDITDKGTLKIKSLNKSHSGTYACEGTNGYGSVRINITVIVDSSEGESISYTPSQFRSSSKLNLSSPVIKRTFSSHVEEDIGGQAIFHCVASGWPVPHIYWFKDGDVVNSRLERGYSSAHSTLKLKILKKSSEGVYSCIARNQLGEDRTDFTLKVKELSSPPRIVSLEPENVKIKEGATAVFWCDVVSKPELKLHIKWFKRLDENEIGPSINFEDKTLFRSGDTLYRPISIPYGVTRHDDVYKSKLVIENSVKVDSGTYVCLALNDRGFSFQNVTLKVATNTPLIANSATRASYFSLDTTSLVIAAAVVTSVILTIIIIVKVIKCRRAKEKPDKRTYCNNMVKCAESESLKQSQRTISSTDRMTDSHTRSTLFFSGSGSDYPSV